MPNPGKLFLTIAGTAATWEKDGGLAVTKPTALMAASPHAVLVEINLTDSVRWCPDPASARIECSQFSPAFLAEGPQRIDGVAAHQIA